jgi:hypothetical protein
MADQKAFAYRMPISRQLMGDSAALPGIVARLVEQAQREASSALHGKAYRLDHVHLTIRPFEDIFPPDDPNHIQNLFAADVRIDITPID